MDTIWVLKFDRDTIDVEINKYVDCMNVDIDDDTIMEVALHLGSANTSFNSANINHIVQTIIA